MGIREKLNDQPAITTGATIGIIVLALIFIVYEIHGGSGPHYKIPTHRYYSDDDGASYYSDDIKLIPPYDHDGKQAVIAFVFRCKGGTPFIGYLQRYTKKGVEALKKSQADPSGNPVMLDEIDQTETEFSKPGAGDKGWARAGTKQSESVVEVKCPDGSTGDLEPVVP